MLKLIAHWISHGLNPAGVALVLWICWWIYHPDEGLVVMVGVLFYIVLPALGLLHGLRKGRMDQLYPEVRQQRSEMLLQGAMSYGLGGGVMWMINPDLLLLVVGISFTLATLLVFCINLFWKISIHCVGVGGAAALIFSISGAGLAWPGVLAVLLVGWARLYLGVHTVAQVLAGFVLGIGVSLAVYWALM